MKRVLIVLLVVLLVSCVQQEIEETKRDIPHFRQISSGNCLQTNAKMALKYYYPEKDFSFELLDEITGRDGDEWTWTTQIMPVLIENGLDAYYYSMSPYDDIRDKGKDFIISFYGEEDGEVILAHTDWDALINSLYVLEDSERYSMEKLDWSYVEEEFFRGSYIIIIVDNSVLWDTGRAFSGHFVTISGINETHVLLHNPASKPYEIHDKQRVIDAWNAPGTDNDIIIVKGVVG